MTHRRTARTLLALTAALAGLAVAAAPAVADSRTDTDRSSPGGGSVPTVVLVHGAWADSTAWSGEVSRLQRAGYPVRVFPTPLRGLAGDAAYLRGFLGTIPGPVVLVGHSYGGAVVSNAATGLTQVRALVFVDAFAPDRGETTAGLATQRPGSVLANDPATVFDVAPAYPGSPAGDSDLYVKPQVFVSSFANDLPAEEAATAAAVQRPITASAVSAPSGEPAWRTIPSWYVVGTLDKVLPPAEQRFMAARAHAHVSVVAGSHLSIQSQPAAITAVIECAARATRR